MMEGRGTLARTWQRYPLRFLDQGKVEGIPAPMARITTCGMVTIEVLTEVEPGDPSRGRYEVIPTQTLRGRGAVPALTLLKLLAGRPHRFATSDWLSEQMRGEMEVGALVRLDTIASYLRGLLCGLKADQRQSDALRVRVVEYLRNGRSSGPGYRLAPYPLIWVDTDALASHVEHGALMERMGEPTLALPFWEQAYQLASKGMYVPDEPSSEWAQDMREQVEGYLRQSVHALSRLTLALHGEAGEEEAIRLLRTYWQGHKTDEDALRPLMELLGKQERFGEAEQYYQQCVAALDDVESSRQPASQTRDLYEFLRVKQLRREPKPASSALLQGVHLNDLSDVSIPSLAHMVQFPKMEHPAFLEMGIREQASFVPSAPDVTLLPSALVSMPFGEAKERDWATWFGLKLALLLSPIESYSGPSESCLELQDKLDRELHTLHIDTNDEAYVRSRRQVLVTLATLPTALMSAAITGQLTSGLADVFLARCAASITACWHLLRGSEFSLIEEILPTYLPPLAYLAQHPSKYQQMAARLTTQGYRLKGILALHRKDFRGRDVYFQQAVHYSTIAQSPGLFVAALISFAYHKQEPTQATQIYQQALPHEHNVSPLQRSRLYAELAVSYAQEKREEEALHSLDCAQEVYPEHPENDPSFLYAEFHPSSMILEKGRTYLALTQHYPQKEYSRLAWKTFAGVEDGLSPFLVPPRIFLEITNYQAETALVQRKLDVCSAYLEKGIRGAKVLGSEKRLEEAVRIQKRAQKVWPSEPRIEELSDLLF
ncbi:MAG: hypothetical protein H0U76_23150 [Ktedonobacteraceae bacterium]|nr:hypothetical protein [Ktedonobacteraceae bacterium]